MPNKPNLEIIGKELLEKYNLKDYRQYFTFDFDINFDINFDNLDNLDNPDNLDNLIKSNIVIKNFIRTKLNISFHDDYIDIIHKKIPEIGLNWHIDDCVIVTKKSVRKNKLNINNLFFSEPKYNKERYIKITENKYLYYNNKFNKLPIKTIIFYSSTYGEDFTGGILKLCDDTEIKPQKYTGIVLDSREAHMVTPVKSGNRFVTLVKIY